ncbi:MAG: SDR family NAD(P)-dependent oxidoreductase [Actinobacteria bacterium]|jgi:3-oxoacyl-[acyl-carrier protein] reductase|nr:SDR family NAD(P)-dependent oxidoreductase [Actinomycetota bacterium]MSW29242.1 SDR family oxidoreductase [Actinomycetota bacterium]MSW32398.1 SDR family oxidoreductase [Actinomycetota bacterium]MSX34779.1 SDR family oxidoreductase [Actinomycetota bacterium]MSX95600.1 SDR family oxidoreductase [Actinomycetota bacterium]
MAETITDSTPGVADAHERNRAMTSKTDGRPALSSELVEQFSLHGRTAVITGAAGGIGRQAAITFTQAGADVLIADVGVAGLEETAEMVAAAGGNATIVPTDVSDRDQVNALADAAIKTHGRLDIWANVAGVIRYMNIVDATPEDVEFITKINLWGTYWGVAAAGRTMTNGGSIINVSSAGGDMPAPTLSIYAMTKAAVSHLTRCAAVELGANNIRVNAIAPGFTDTPMVQSRWTNADGSTNEAERESYTSTRAAQSPLRTIATPEDQSWAMLYLASDASRFITGQVIRPNGGVVMA